MMDTGPAAAADRSPHPGFIPLFLKPSFNPNPNPNPKKKRKLLQELVKSSAAPYQYAASHADRSPSLNSSPSNRGETNQHISMITNHNNHSNHHHGHTHNISNKHNPKRVCRICGRQFSSGRALGGHMRVHGELFNSSSKYSSNTSNHSYVPTNSNPDQIHASHMIDRPQKINHDDSAKISPRETNPKSLKYNYTNSSSVTHHSGHYTSQVYNDYKMPPLQAAVRYWPADKVASNWDNNYFQYLQDSPMNGRFQGHKSEEEEEEELEEEESVSGSDSESELEMDNNINIQTLMLGTDNSEVEDQGAEDLYLAGGICESKPSRKLDNNGLILQHNNNYKLRANPKRSKRFSHELDDHESFPTGENPAINGNKICANNSAGHNISNMIMEAKGLGSSLAPKDDRKSVKCSECGKGFWSWKALFGHMRCHPEREWRGILPPNIVNPEQTTRTSNNVSSSLEDRLIINKASSKKKKKVLNRYSGIESSQNILDDSGAREGDHHDDLGATHWPRGKRSRPRRIGSKEAGLNLRISSNSQEEEDEEEEEAGVQEQDASETTSVETGQEEDRGNLIGRKEGHSINGGPVINSLLLLAEAAKRVQEEEESEEFAGPNEDIVNDDLQATTEEGDDEDEEGDELLKEQLHHDEDAKDKMAGLEANNMVRYECATCNKSFPSHQALGGHRASHRRMKGCFAKTTSVADSEASTSGEEAPELWLAPAQDPAPTMTHNKVSDNNKQLSLSPEVMQRPSPSAQDHLIMQRPCILPQEVSMQLTAPLSPMLNLAEKDKRAIHLSPGKGHECTICHRVFSTGQALGGHKRCHWTGVDKSVDTISMPSSSPTSSGKVVSGATTAQFNYRVSGYTIEHARQCMNGENERGAGLDLNLPAPMDDVMQAYGVEADGSQMFGCETELQGRDSRVLVESPGGVSSTLTDIYHVGVKEALEGRCNSWNFHDGKSSSSDVAPARYNKKLDGTNMWAMQWPMLNEGSRAPFPPTQ